MPAARPPAALLGGGRDDALALRARLRRRGEKTYASAAEARRYATAFDREDSDELGKRSPLSLLPLRFARRSGRSRS